MALAVYILYWQLDVAALYSLGLLVLLVPMLALLWQWTGYLQQVMRRLGTERLHWVVEFVQVCSLRVMNLVSPDGSYSSGAGWSRARGKGCSKACSRHGLWWRRW